jgi:hypothetical protein
LSAYFWGIGGLAIRPAQAVRLALPVKAGIAYINWSKTPRLNGREPAAILL